MSSGLQIEVVDDSEPEREELRQREKSIQKLKPGIAKTVRRLCKPVQVIEITDDESEDALQSMPRIRQSSEQSVQPSARRNLRHSPLPSSSTLPHIINRTRASPNLYTNGSHLDNTCSPTSVTTDPLTDDEGENTKINLIRFAYPGSTSSVKVTGSKPRTSRQDYNSIPVAESKPPPKKKLLHRFAEDFSESELNKLTKCVSCEVRWTSRKTATQKMLHVQACAKKKLLLDATVRILIRKAIDASFTVDTVPSKATGKAKAENPAPVDPKTFLEELVADSARRKKGRRADIKESVQSVVQTRGDILNRARTVLGASSMPDDRGFWVQTQAIGIRNLDVDDEVIASTQRFGVSALAQRYQVATPLFSSKSPIDDEESDLDVPPATQTFAPSKLSSARSPTDTTKWHEHSLVNYTLASPRAASPINISDISSKGPSPLMSRANRTIEKLDVSLLGSLKSLKQDDSDTMMFRDRSDQSGWDVAVLHFEPQEEKMITTLSTPPTASCKTNTEKSPCSKTQKLSPTKKQGVKSMATKLGEMATPSTRTKTPSRRRVGVEDEPDNVWDAKMKERIIRDTDLHLRILRYEPIHFNVFLQLLLEPDALASGKLKARLHRFLDCQAIHFYGAESSSGRRGQRK